MFFWQPPVSYSSAPQIYTRTSECLSLERKNSASSSMSLSISSKLSWPSLVPQTHPTKISHSHSAPAQQSTNFSLLHPRNEWATKWDGTSSSNSDATSQPSSTSTPCSSNSIDPGTPQTGPPFVATPRTSAGSWHKSLSGATPSRCCKISSCERTNRRN